MHRTRNMASDTDFKFIMETILGQKEDSPLSKAFERDAITDIGDIMCIPDRYIDQLKFPDDTSGKIVLIELGQGYRTLIHCFQAFVLMKNAEGKPVQGDFQNLVDKAEFQEFGIASFGIDVIPNEPPGLSSHLYTLTDNTVLVLEVDDRIDSIPSKSPGLDGYLRMSPSFNDLDEHRINVLPDDSIPSKPPGLDGFTLDGSIRLVADNSVIDLDDEGGIDVTLSEPRLSTLLVIVLDDEDGIDELQSEPTGLDSRRLYTSSDNGIIDLIDDDNGIDVLVVDDSIRLFALDPLDGENWQSSRIVKLVQDDAEDVRDQVKSNDLDDEDGIDKTPSKPPGLLGSRLSTSVDNNVIDLDDNNGIDVLIPGDPIRSFDSDDDSYIALVGFHADCGIKNALPNGSIPSEPPGLGSPGPGSLLSSLSNDSVIDVDEGIDGMQSPTLETSFVSPIVTSINSSSLTTHPEKSS
jgi:hypothetical protein